MDYYKLLLEIAKRQDQALQTARVTIHTLHGETNWNDFAKRSRGVKQIDAALKEWLQFNATGN